MAINNYYKYQSSHLGKNEKKKNHTMLNLFVFCINFETCALIFHYLCVNW